MGMNTDALDSEFRSHEQPDAATVLKAFARFLGRQAARDLVKADYARSTSDPSMITDISEE